MGRLVDKNCVNFIYVRLMPRGGGKFFWQIYKWRAGQIFTFWGLQFLISYKMKVSDSSGQLILLPINIWKNAAKRWEKQASNSLKSPQILPK